MHIGIITPAAPKSLNGNRATAMRWGEFLTELGHRVTVSVRWEGEVFDVMLALHAWRSAESIAKFKDQCPDKPLIVAMTGTDLYRFIHSHPQATLSSIYTADKLIVLHDLAYRVLPESVRQKIHIIHQSARPVQKIIKRSKRTFDICVVGHLREEKDSLRVAYAVRNLPKESRIRVLHYGKAHNEQWASYAEDEMKINSRYHWLGEVPHWKVRQAYTRCHLMVLPSLMEGGANVISEACVAGLPVVASDIDGSVGLLGENYQGYFPVKDENRLQAILLRAESDSSFVNELAKQCERRAELFCVEKERDGIRQLIDSLKTKTS